MPPHTAFRVSSSSRPSMNRARSELVAIAHPAGNGRREVRPSSYARPRSVRIGGPPPPALASASSRSVHRASNVAVSSPAANCRPRTYARTISAMSTASWSPTL
jgi:hypothetical protein